MTEKRITNAFNGTPVFDAKARMEFIRRVR